MSDENESKEKKSEYAHPPSIERAKILEISGTNYVRVPREWLENHNLKKGDEVMLFANSDLTVRPKTREAVRDAHEGLEELVKREKKKEEETDR